MPLLCGFSLADSGGRRQVQRRKSVEQRRATVAELCGTEGTNIEEAGKPWGKWRILGFPYGSKIGKRGKMMQKMVQITIV